MKVSNRGDIQLSKLLSWLLRHGAIKEQLPISSEGYIQIEHILQYRTIRNKYSIEDIKRVVANDNKQRYSLRSSSTGTEIRANQGHSISVVEDLELHPITEESQCKNVIHGTYMKNWENIKLQGLSKVKRNHIHFAEDLPNRSTVISGMRRDAEVYIYINLKKALIEGLTFFQSANKVILSPGDEKGFITPKFFLKVCNANGLPLNF